MEQKAHSESMSYLNERQGWIADGVELLSGDREQNPLDVLPSPTQIRDDAEGLQLTSEQEANLREIAGRFGIGGEQDLVIEADYQIMEGGKPWKVEAEAKLAGSSKSMVFAGSPYRALGADETNYIAEKLDANLTDKTEYDTVRLIAERQDGFVALEEDEILPFGYDISDGFKLVSEATGQLVHIGNKDGKSVVLLRVDRENYVDEDEKDENKKNKYRNQPDSAALMGVVADILQTIGDEESTVGLNTSNTYASRAIDAVRVGLGRNRVFSVGMYGRETIADVQGKSAAEPTPVNQIPGELRVMHEKLQLLASELDR